MPEPPCRPPAAPTAAPPCAGAEGAAAAAAVRLEGLRRAYQRTRGRIRALRERERCGPLPPTAAAKLAELCREADRLWQDLLQAGRGAGASDDAAAGGA